MKRGERGGEVCLHDWDGMCRSNRQDGTWFLKLKRFMCVLVDKLL